MYPALDAKYSGEPPPVASYNNVAGVVNIQPGNTNIYGTTGEPREWKNNLCDCFNDCGECACAYFCTLCYAFEVFKRADEHCCSCCFGGLVPLRTKVRTERNIQGDIYKDYFAIACCGFCALVQLGQELKNG